MNDRELWKRNEKATNLKAFRLEENLFAVESSEGEKLYKVKQENGSTFCTCPDAQKHCGENGWKCKHILAVEQFLGNGHEENHSCWQCKRLNRQLLETPFEPSQIKQREGANGKMLDYVEGHAVIKRLNDAFDGMWSFEIIHNRVLDDEVVVLGKLKVNGISKMQFGSSKITLSKDNKLPICLGDDLKAAATDALKKAATHFGVGLHLYEEKNGAENSRGNDSAPKKPEKREAYQNNHQPERITNKQLAAIYSIAKEKGITGKDVEQRTLNVYKKKPEYLNKQEASEVIKQLCELEVEVQINSKK